MVGKPTHRLVASCIRRELLLQQLPLTRLGSTVDAAGQLHV